MIKRLRSYTSYSEENGKLVPSIEPHLVQGFEKPPEKEPPKKIETEASLTNKVHTTENLEPSKIK